jgi:hypothetical protein
MNEPRRLVEDNPTGLERKLLTAGAAYRSSGAARRKTLAALGLVGTAAASAGVAAASSSLLGKAGLSKLVTASVLGVAVLTPLGIVAWNEVSTVPARPVASVVRAVPAPHKAIEKAPLPPLVTEPPIETPAIEPPQPRADTRAGALSAELGVLDAARAKLGSGDPRGALAILDDYARTYPRGRLGVEAEVLRIDALSRAGDKTAVRKRAEAFLKRHPKSVLAARVRRYLDEPR